MNNLPLKALHFPHEEISPLTNHYLRGCRDNVTLVLSELCHFGLHLPKPVFPLVRLTIRNSPVISGYLILNCPAKEVQFQ